MTKQKNILAVGAHGDDVEIGCGGTLALHNKNANVYILIMTSPFYSDYKGKCLRKEEEGKVEEINGANILGAKHINLGFPTKNVPYSQESVEKINEVIDKYNIDTIYTHWLHDTHQDHLRTTQSVLSAGRHVQNILMYEPEYPAGRSFIGFRNQYYVDITSTMETKIQSIEQHKSQVDKYGGKKFIEAITARCQHRGYEIGKEYSECFEIIRLSQII